MDSKFSKIEEKLDKLSDKLDGANSRISDVDKGLAVYNEQLKINDSNLKEHMKRTELLEDKLDKTDKKVLYIDTIFKLAIGLIGLLGTIFGIYSALK